ncbi:hypothetical protein NDU88_005477 [Pleurodeles waltl]|uniref:Uncharacterized protein n=1 Tax=Pleurodeles waltl TaxID=8319 RepID=A0AAV7L358_PLEWA|nr:hypothetical protein NDU88_005477 [Pleurodeles waltl]
MPLTDHGSLFPSGGRGLSAVSNARANRAVLTASKPASKRLALLSRWGRDPEREAPGPTCPPSGVEYPRVPGPVGAALAARGALDVAGARQRALRAPDVIRGAR